LEEGVSILFPSLLLAAAAVAPPSRAPIQLNDNIRAAGRQDGTTLTVSLVASTGVWRPNGSDGTALEVAAFGEEGGNPSIPGPLLRAREGTTVALAVRNALGSDLRVFGLCGRPGPCEPLLIAAGDSRRVEFRLTTPGVYYYWASSSARTLGSRPRGDSQLGGAIVVDPRDGAPRDRVMVISIFQDGPAFGLCNNAGDDAVFAINGASWPHTPRLRYATGETVRWKVVNLSCDQHAMHLHGFHFTIDSRGDGNLDGPVPWDVPRTAVTEVVPPGRTFSLAWTPTRAGNWLFHCHMVVHMAPPAASMHAGHGGAAAAGMAGLVMGIEVTGPPEAAAAAPPSPRRFSLMLREEPNRYGDRKGFRMDLEGVDAPKLDPGPVPGPVIVLRRDEPVEITVSNRMTEPTAIHWHGIEVESYFDGVPGFGGVAGSISPPVGPGESFVARLNPPRAGTFIYHTHWHDESQLAGGMYGALIVLAPGERYDPETDHVVIIGLNGVLTNGEREPFALNGRSSPAPIALRAGSPNRLRLINITANNVALNVFLVGPAEVAQWTLVAKDGAAVPREQATLRPARQQIGVGETYDFEVTAVGPQNLWLEVRRGSGEWVLQAPVHVR
jgi:FtsP/CotA-like multicopper oxidase with cupredoxin domain